MPFSAWMTARSERCGPIAAPPAAASLRRLPASAARSRSSAASAGISSSQSSTVPTSARRARGNGAVGLGAGPVEPLDASRRAAATATPCAAMISSSAASQAGSSPGRRATAASARASPAHRRATRAACAGSSAEHQPVEKAPPRRRAFDKQPVHLRGQPEDAELLAERRLAACRLAVDADDAPLAAGGVAAGADPDRAASRRDRRRDGPARRRAARAGRVRRSISPSRAPRRPRPGARNDIASSRLVLPAPLGPVSTTGRGVEVEPGRAIIAEIGEHEPGRRATRPHRPACLAASRGTGALMRASCAAASIARYMVRNARISSVSRQTVGSGWKPRFKPASASARRARCAFGAVAHDGRRAGVGHHELDAPRPRSAR